MSSSKAYISYVLWKGYCELASVFRECCGLSIDIAARILRHNIVGSHIEEWLRVSYDKPDTFRKFIRALKKRKIEFKIAYRGKNSVVLWVRYHNRCNCDNCILTKTPSMVMIKTSMITSIGVIHELLHLDKNLDRGKADEWVILTSGGIEEVMKYLLTQKEQESVYKAYMKGYYDIPRALGLEELAVEMNISVSTLNEILRSAEKKIMDAFMKHDMPHLILKNILQKIGAHVAYSS
ncbi:MAG: helix-turn-helix domain-containing protein [Acidilobaceae archaeon]